MKRFPGQHRIDLAAGAMRRAGAGRGAPAVAVFAGSCAPNVVENDSKTVSLIPQGRATAP